MRHSLRPLGLALVLGCASPAAPVPASPAEAVVVPVASAPATPAPPVIEEPAPAPAEVREPVEAGCRVAGVGWSSDQLRLHANGKRFARADRVRATVVLPVTAKPSEAIAVMDDRRVLVRAVLSLADVRLHLAKPTALLGILTPAAKTSLPWTASTPGGIHVELETKGVLRSPQPIAADVTCTELAIVAATYDARDAISKKTLPKRDVITDHAALAPAHQATPVAELTLGVEVELVETRGGQARILVDRSNFVLSGWVSQKDLGPATPRGYGTGYGRLGMRDSKINQMHFTHCPKDVSLFVELGSERVKVGLIHKESGFRVKAENEADKGAALREIDFPESQWLIVEKEARFLMEAADLRGCTQGSPGF